MRLAVFFMRARSSASTCPLSPIACSKNRRATERCGLRRFEKRHPIAEPIRRPIVWPRTEGVSLKELWLCLATKTASAIPIGSSSDRFWRRSLSLSPHSWHRSFDALAFSLPATCASDRSRMAETRNAARCAARERGDVGGGGRDSASNSRQLGISKSSAAKRVSSTASSAVTK